MRVARSEQSYVFGKFLELGDPQFSPNPLLCSDAGRKNPLPGVSTQGISSEQAGNPVSSKHDREDAVAMGTGLGILLLRRPPGGGRPHDNCPLVVHSLALPLGQPGI